MRPKSLEAVEAAEREACALAHRAVEDLEARGARAVLDEVRAMGDERRLV